MFGETTPPDLQKDPTSGAYNLETAGVVKLIYALRFTEEERKAYEAFDREMLKIAEDVHEENTFEVGTLTSVSFYYYVFRDIDESRVAIVFSLTLVLSYALFILGNCTPVGCRIVTGLLSTLVVVFSLISGFSVAGTLGKIFYADGNAAIAFVIVGIGVDDIFILTSGVDLQDLRLKPHVVMSHAMAEAGSMLTLTSMTSSMMFFISSISIFQGVESLSTYAGFSVLFAYFYVLTFYAAILTYDVRR